jgi:hypothetical protein
VTATDGTIDDRTVDTFALQQAEALRPFRQSEVITNRDRSRSHDGNTGSNRRTADGVEKLNDIDRNFDPNYAVA